MFSIFCNVSPYMVLHKRPNSNLWSAVNSNRMNFSRTGTETICRVRLSFCPLLLLQGEIEQGNFSNLPSLHALACSIKVTEDSCNLMFQVVVTRESACAIWEELAIDFFHANDQLTQLNACNLFRSWWRASQRVQSTNWGELAEDTGSWQAQICPARDLYFCFSPKPILSLPSPLKGRFVDCMYLLIIHANLKFNPCN